MPKTISKTAEITDLKKFFSFPAGEINGIPFCLSSITYADAWKGYLILTSTEAGDCPSGSNTLFPGRSRFQGNLLWFLPDTDLSSTQDLGKFQEVKPQKVEIFGINIKAEGIVVLNNSDNTGKTIRVGIAYDNDRDDDGMYQKITLIDPLKNP